MVEVYEYKIWKSGKFLGTRIFLFPLAGRYVTIPYFSLLKESYNRRIKDINVPLISIPVGETYNQTIIEVVLDVSKKSKKQISTILNTSRPT